MEVIQDVLGWSVVELCWQRYSLAWFSVVAQYILDKLDSMESSVGVVVHSNSQWIFWHIGRHILRSRIHLSVVIPVDV